MCLTSCDNGAMTHAWCLWRKQSSAYVCLWKEKQNKEQQQRLNQAAQLIFSMPSGGTVRRHQKAARNEVRVAEGKLARSIAHCHSVQAVPHSHLDPSRL